MPSSKCYINLLLCLIALKAFTQSPVVLTTDGYIRGVAENGVQVFKGVPYAAPPVGSLRYMPPARHEHWTDTLNTSSFGSQAMQPTGNSSSGAENCLYLNVYTPAIDKRKRPVVVWVHGGSMTNGTGGGMNGHAFADKDDIVTITINYRLGALGFLYLGDLDKRYAQSGNLGLLDVISVLKWIHENIAAFGGDPERVTVMGESAGAKLISAVMVAPASKGLFRQTILESGSVQCIRDVTTAVNERSRLLKQLGLAPGDVRKLLDIPADTLIRAQGKICAGIGGNSQFGPVYDGVTITEDAYRYAATGDLSGIRVLMGTNEDEGAGFTGPAADYVHANASIFEPLFQSNAPMAYAFYNRRLRSDPPYAAAVKTLTEYMYQMHTYRLAKALTSKGTPVWMYQYKYQGHQPFGARHGNELRYIWDAAKILNTSTNSAERQLALNMHKAWVNFITTGEPQAGTLPKWPRYAVSAPQVMLFDTTNTVKMLTTVYDDPDFPSAVYVIKPKLRIAIAGLGIESSTFSPALTEEPAFHARYDTAVYGAYPFLGVDSALRKQVEWVPAIVGKSLPGGAVTKAAYESLVGKMLDSLQKHLPYDGLWFDIHGAMSVVGLDDPEGDMIKRIRKVVGPKVLISTSMDLHGNVSEDLAKNSDLITCYRMAPHEDAMDTKRRAVQNLLTRLESGKGRPAYKAWIPIPVLLPGEKTSTRIEPGKSIYAAVAPAAAEPGIIDAAIWIGYAWADEPRNHAVVMVTGDDKDKVTHTAENLAHLFWNAREQFAFVAPTAPWPVCLDSALKSRKHPFFISDMGDNPTAGGAGDVTWTLTQILAHPAFKKANGPALIYASIPGPELVEKAIAVGVGGKVDGYAGGKIDARYAPPVHIEGVVESIVNGDKDAEVEVAILVGSVHVIVTRKRKPYHKEADFTRLGLAPRQADVVVVKIGYLEPELYAMRADWIMALTPGGVDQDIEHLPYKRIQRPMFPMDKGMKEPDLSARLMPFAD